MKRKYLLMLLVVLVLFTFTGCKKKAIAKTKLVKNKDYYVRGEFTGTYLDIKKRGYYINSLNQSNAPYLYIICMGEKSTGGYSLNIKEVNKIGNKTEIIVEEIIPSEDEMVTTAFTSPTVVIEFPEYQADAIIKNTNNEEFSYLKD